MERYFVNKKPQPGGEHEIHRLGCRYLPTERNCLYLGEFRNCMEALGKARIFYPTADGCYFCCRPCHKV